MMFGWTKKEKNEKSLNKAKADMAKLTPKDRGAKLSRLRKRYPNRGGSGGFDFDMELFDYDLVILYLLFCDDLAVEEADLYDNPIEEPVEEPMEDVTEELVESAVVADAIEEAVTAEVEPEPVVETQSFDSSVDNTPAPSYTPEPVERTAPSYSPEPTQSFDSDSYGGGGGGDSFSSDDGGGGDD